MKPVLICPKCGRSEEQVRFIDAFCIDDYPLNIKAPGKEELQRCKRCGRMLFRGEWMAYDEGKIEKHILGKCRGEFAGASYDFGRQVVAFTIRRGDKELKVEKQVPLIVTINMCQRCNQISGGYYQGIVQLRGNRAKVERYAKMIAERLEKVTFISKTEEMDGGIDLYVGSSKAVLAAVTQLGVRALITKKLIGREEGKRLYRTTFAIRL
ncbi:MAG: NMD3-related protein [Candidatus ainarchaeum sp.]|nr:NMD3-related protein [Candidatus ainarchaeum sp.]